MDSRRSRSAEDACARLDDCEGLEHFALFDLGETGWEGVYSDLADAVRLFQMYFEFGSPPIEDPVGPPMGPSLFSSVTRKVMRPSTAASRAVC